MEIDTSGLPLDFDPETDPGALQRRAAARLEATEAWLDQDDAAIDRIAAEQRDLALDLDPLREDLMARWGEVAATEERAGTLDALTGTLGRLALAAGDSDDPDLRQRHGDLVRRMIEDHAGAGLIDAAGAEGLADGYDARLAESDAGRLTRRDPALAYRLMADTTLFTGLSPERRTALGRIAEARAGAQPMDAETMAADGAAAHAGSALADTARERARLGRRLAAGDAGLADIAAAEAAGSIDARGADTLRNRFEARRAKLAAAAEGITRVEAVLAEGRGLDPASAEDRVAIDAHYGATRKGWDEAGLTPDEVRAELAGYLNLAGVVPEDVSRRIGRHFRVGTPAERWEAADLIARLGEARPELLRQIDPGDVQIGLGIAALEKAGWPPEQAAERYEVLQTLPAGDPGARRDRLALERSELGRPAEQTETVTPADWPPPPEPLRKPHYRPLVGPPFPPNQEQVLRQQGEKWDDFYRATGRLSESSDRERYALQMLYGQEGGHKTNPINDSASGILKGTLAGLIRRGKVSGIAAGTLPEKLSLDERAIVYRAYFDDVLGTVGGGRALGRLPDDGTAAAFADVLFREGRKDGSTLLQQALNAVEPGLVDVDGAMGPKLFEAFVKIAGDPKRRDSLLTQLADLRLRAANGEERPRFDFYRPQNAAGSPAR